MHQTEVNRIRKEIWRLAVAELDMQYVAAAAEKLVESPISLLEGVDMRPVLEAGLVVTYCRSFSGPPRADRAPKHVVDQLAPEGRVHAELWEARNKVHAHTDDEYKDQSKRREIIDQYDSHSYEAESPTFLRRDQLVEIRAVALALVEIFRAAREERENAYREAGVPSQDWRGLD